MGYDPSTENAATHKTPGKMTKRQGKFLSLCIYIHCVCLCYSDATKVRRLVSQITKKHGSVGFEYELNKSQRAIDRNVAINSSQPRPKKRQKVSVNTKSNNHNDPNVKSKSHSKPQKPQPPSSKSKPKSNSTNLLAPSWRWSPKRRTIAVKQAVKYRLFDIKIVDGKRDSKINVIVSEMNGMTDIDINFVLLTVDSYKKEIYRIQRKVLKFKEDQLDLLPEEEQQLHQQLKQSGHVAEANKSRMSANSS